MPLTDIVVRKAKSSGKTCKFFDGRGLYLEVSPTGNKWWRFKYRFGGKEKRLALGVYPDVGLKDARDRRDAARKLLASHVDPGEHRKAQKQARMDDEANSFEVLAREWFAKNSPTWAVSHSDRVMRRLERDVFPWLGRRPITDIHAPEILTVLRKAQGAAHSQSPLIAVHRTQYPGNILGVGFCRKVRLLDPGKSSAKVAGWVSVSPSSNDRIAENLPTVIQSAMGSFDRTSSLNSTRLWQCMTAPRWLLCGFITMIEMGTKQH